MDVDKNIPFPQANNFNNILLILEIDDEKKLSDNKYLMELLSLGTTRQISYYLSACEFLGIIDHKRKFTEFGIELRNTEHDLLLIKLSQKIISMPVFGEVFFYNYFFDSEMDTREISSLINAIYGIENEKVCDRRSSTVKKWIVWINSQKTA